MKTIGIIGGMGPMAGLDLHRKIIEETVARTDQEHLDVVHVSFPGAVTDRTDWLLEGTGRHPAHGMLEMVNRLALLRVSVAGVPCNTAHVHPILGLVRFAVREAKLDLLVLDMIAETVRTIQTDAPDIARVGLLATTGTVRSGVYAQRLARAGLEVVVPDAVGQGTVHNAIYDPVHGIKANMDAVGEHARAVLVTAAGQLVERGAQALILGCTELPLAIRERELHGVPVLDPTRILARALIRAVDPEKLRE